MNTQKAFKILDIIINGNLNNTFTNLDNIIFVNLDFLTNRSYQFEGVNEYLYYIGQQKDCTIVFIQRDGVNLRYTGMLEIITQTIKDLKLTSDTCFFYGYNNYDIKNCTFLELDAVKMWCGLFNNCIRGLPISGNDFKYYFAGLFGRADLYRALLYKHLSNKNSLLSWNTNTLTVNHRHVNNFSAEAGWFVENQKTSLDYDTNTGSILYQQSLEDIKKHYHSYFIEIVSETDVHNDSFFTEKTLKNFYLGKPFILLSGQGSLDKLKRYGFQTFAPYINEGYNDYSNVYDRINAIKCEIDRIQLLSNAELSDIYNRLKPIFEHNKYIFERLVNDNS